jgi:hypothetical protein
MAFLTLEDELSKMMQLDVAPVIEKIQEEGGGLEGLGRIIEEVVLPLIGAQRKAILRMAQDVDEIRRAVAGEDAGDCGQTSARRCVRAGWETSGRARVVHDEHAFAPACREEHGEWGLQTRVRVIHFPDTSLELTTLSS